MARMVNDGDVVAFRRIGADSPWPPTYELHRFVGGTYVPLPLPVSEETADSFGRREAGGAR